MDVWCQETASEKVFHIQKRSCDCIGAISISDKIGPLVANHAFGYKIDLHQKDETPYVINYEHNSVWYKFRSKTTGDLYIDIIPVDPSEDINFMLYQSPGPWFCDDFKSDFSLYPIRSNLSSTPGNTGLNKSGTEEVISSSQPTSYSQVIPINAGDEFYLVVDTETKISAGHSVVIKVE